MATDSTTVPDTVDDVPQEAVPGGKKKTSKTKRPRDVAVPVTTTVSSAARAVLKASNSDGRLWATTWSSTPELSEQIVVDIVRPAIVEDVRSMSKGRVVWRNVATASETLGRLSTAASTVLAFASASEVAGENSSRILGFVAGGVGTLGLVLGSLANFARTQSIERSEAMNLILKEADIESVPDINAALEINNDDP